MSDQHYLAVHRKRTDRAKLAASFIYTARDMCAQNAHKRRVRDVMRLAVVTDYDTVKRSQTAKRIIREIYDG